jgi:ATP-dependent RNA helicase DDX19/DBP5
MRINRADPSTQVLVICNTKIMVTQIAGIYKKTVEFCGITVKDTTEEEGTNAQVLVCTTGKMKALASGRKKFKLDKLKVLVFDEADVYFTDDNYISDIHKYILPSFSHDIQYVFFSATYPSVVKSEISKFVKEAAAIELKNDKLALDNIVQFKVEVPPKGKIDYLMKLHECCQLTQCIIFVNTRSFAITIQRVLKEKGLKANLVFGKGMEDDERSKVIQKFRDNSIQFLITTDLISRGFDVSTVKLVVNFDVPTEFMGRDKPPIACPETYLHRIGRGGRFGTKAVSVTLMDRPQDKEFMIKIADEYNMHARIHELEDPQQVQEVLKKITQEENNEET